MSAGATSGTVTCRLDGCGRTAAVRLGRMPVCSACLPRALARRSSVTVRPIPGVKEGQAVITSFLEALKGGAR